VHKPDCLLAQGKIVSESVRVKAERALVEREGKSKAKEEKAAQEHSRKIKANIETFAQEGPQQVDTFSHTCLGESRRADLPWSSPNVESAVASFLGLEVEQVLSLGVLPDGIREDELSGHGRGVLINNPETGAKIIVLHQRLFEDGGNGNLNGHAIDGIFVVEKVIPNSNRARWRRVPTPPYTDGQNRIERFATYLSHANEESKAVPEGVDLGIHNPPEPTITYTPTANGDCMHLKF